MIKRISERKDGKSEKDQKTCPACGAELVYYDDDREWICPVAGGDEEI